METLKSELFLAYILCKKSRSLQVMLQKIFLCKRVLILLLIQGINYE